MVCTCLHLQRATLLRCGCFLSRHLPSPRPLSSDLAHLPTVVEQCLQRITRVSCGSWQHALTACTATATQSRSLRHPRSRASVGFEISLIHRRCIHSSTALHAAKKDPADLVKRISRGGAGGLHTKSCNASSAIAELELPVRGACRRRGHIFCEEWWRRRPECEQGEHQSRHQAEHRQGHVAGQRHEGGIAQSGAQPFYILLLMSQEFLSGQGFNVADAARTFLRQKINTAVRSLRRRAIGSTKRVKSWLHLPERGHRRKALQPL